AQAPPPPAIPAMNPPFRRWPQLQTPLPSRCLGLGNGRRVSPGDFGVFRGFGDS
uniref:Delta antigen n=1 Tax=Bursaphelenchus xylophilus TaxID=6326 RepID=A0A1I7SKM3_BURXY